LPEPIEPLEPEFTCADASIAVRSAVRSAVRAEFAEFTLAAVLAVESVPVGPGTAEPWLGSAFIAIFIPATGRGSLRAGFPFSAVIGSPTGFPGYGRDRQLDIHG